MTTIVYRSGVMAADSRGYSGGKMPVGTKTKVFRDEHGTLVGCSSSKPGQAEAVVRWFMDGADIEQAPKFAENNFRLLAVFSSGEAFIASDSFNLAGPLRAEFFAVGSGEEYAMGAMAMGAGPERAVEIACQMDIWSGGPVVALAHHDTTDQLDIPRDEIGGLTLRELHADAEANSVEIDPAITIEGLYEQVQAAKAAKAQA